MCSRVQKDAKGSECNCKPEKVGCTKISELVRALQEIKECLLCMRKRDCKQEVVFIDGAGI